MNTYEHLGHVSHFNTSHLRNGIHIDGSGNKLYIKRQTKHREDGPAAIYANGRKEWWMHGKRHREGGPAIEDASGTKAWFLNDRKHRIDGPAIEWADGDVSWYLDGYWYEFRYWIRGLEKIDPEHATMMKLKYG